MNLKFLLILFLFLPLAINPWGNNYYELPKFLSFAFFTQLLLIVYWRQILTSFEKLLKQKLGILVLLLFFWLIVTSVFGVSWSQSLLGNYYRQQGLLFLLYSFLFFLLVKEVSLDKLSKKEKERLAVVVCSGAILAALFKTFGHPVFQGGYLLLTLPFSFYLFKKNKYYFPLFLIQLSLIYLSGSRLALFLGFLVLAFYFFKFKKKRLAFFLLLLLLGFLPLLKSTSPYENRFQIWSVGTRAFREKPIAGWGWANFEFAHNDSLLETDIGLEHLKIDKAHNLFLEVVVASGLPGLVLSLTIVYLTVKRLWLKTRKGRDWDQAIFLSSLLWLIRASINPLSIAELAFGLFLFAQSFSLFEKKTKKDHLSKLFFYPFLLVSLFLMSLNFRSLSADIYFKKGLRWQATNPAKSTLYFKKSFLLFPWEKLYYFSLKRYN